MASLNDIETKMQNIVDVLERRSVSTITGTLPMTFRSNGTALINYRIYGTANGAGVQTENLFDNQLEQGTMIATGEESATNRIRYDTPVAVEVNTVYSQFATAVDTSKTLEFIPFGFNGSIWVALTSGWKPLNTNFNTGACALVRMLYCFSDNTDITPTDVTNVMFVKGSTAPKTFIPYGYKLPLTLTRGTESKDTNIYIGDSKLLSGDYVDYESGKIVRNGTPQDPPLPLPELETFSGENTLDSTETLGEVTIKGKIKEVI